MTQGNNNNNQAIHNKIDKVKLYDDNVTSEEMF